MSPPHTRTPNLPMEVPEASSTHVYRTVGGVELRIFVFTPPMHAASDARPAIVWFFGGGWVDGHPKQFAPQCAYLASRGMVAMTAEYRVKNRHGVTPDACVDDAAAAVRWVRAHAAALGVDPQRVAAGGGSAGGHIAACIGVRAPAVRPDEAGAVSSRPDALVLFNPGLMVDAGDDSQPLPAAYEARIAERLSRLERAALSPYRALSHDSPPTLILHGEADQTVPIETALRYAEKARRLGVRCELVAYPGQAHGFFNHHRSAEMFQSTMRSVDAFLASLGYLAGPPTIDRFQWPIAAADGSAASRK